MAPLKVTFGVLYTKQQATHNRRTLLQNAAGNGDALEWGAAPTTSLKSHGIGKQIKNAARKGKASDSSTSNILMFLLAAQCVFFIVWYMKKKNSHGMAAAGDVMLSSADEDLLNRLRNRDYIANVRPSSFSRPQPNPNPNPDQNPACSRPNPNNIIAVLLLTFIMAD